MSSVNARKRVSQLPAEWPSETRIILFDGVCKLCNRSVLFILRRDPAAFFRFATLQSETGQALLKEIGKPAEYRESFLLLERQGEAWRVYQKSSAALRVAGFLGQPWPCFGVFRLIPTVLRDAAYDWVGRNRYRWFGRHESCPVPDPAWMSRFLP